MLNRRVYVEEGRSKYVHLASNLADFVVLCPEGQHTIPRQEVVRVLRPRGRAFLGKEVLVKPVPEGVDDWSHAYHGPDNNPQSTDQRARAPYLTQFLAAPWFVPPPGVTVATDGRLFKAFGHIAYHKREWEWRHMLVATNGYNGTVLWKRPLEEGFMIHRNAFVATPEMLYVADSTSCKMIDTTTGQLQGEIVAPTDATGPVWKWMALDDGVLYGLVGVKEYDDPGHKQDWGRPGWPWKGMSPGYDLEEYPWGFGRTLFAVDPRTKEVLWIRKDEHAVDGRAICMKNGRIYYYAHPKYLVCINAKQGKTAWRSDDPKLLESIGAHDPAQTWYRGMSTQGYLKCSDEAVYFAGPQRKRLVAVSASDGRLLWDFPNGNFQLVLRDEGLYAMGPTAKARDGKMSSKLFDPLTGRVLAELGCYRGNCTRATGSIDSILSRGDAHGGTLRLTVPQHASQRIAPIRPPCHDGVIIAGGMLHWGAWICDCNLSLVGNVCLAPAGAFDFHAKATNVERLRSTTESKSLQKPLQVLPGDWPAYRADTQCSAASRVDIPQKIELAWQHQPEGDNTPAAPVTAGGLVFCTGSDGVVRALDGAEGKVRWTAYTGGAIMFPPAIADGRLFVGSADGWVYSYEAATGRPLWRFRAAPAERKINLYGQLASTWPVASGVLTDGKSVYAAAGIASYDGTHVYALDAATGRLRWQNNTSGNLAGAGEVTGVSVQGHLLLHQDRLYLAGGNVVSPAVYDTRDGRCLNKLDDVWGKAPRGCDLFLTDGEVVAFDRLLYSPKEYQQGEFTPYQPSRYFARHFLQAHTDDILIRCTGGWIRRVASRTKDGKEAALWESEFFKHATAMALGNNAILVAGLLPPAKPESASQFALAAFRLDDGHVLWSHQLNAMPTAWGIALDNSSRITVALQDGTVLCLAASD